MHLRPIFKWISLITLLVVVNVGVSALLYNWSDQLGTESSFMLNATTLLFVGAFILLLAIPFVPGVEIAISLMIFQGSSVAPVVFIATILGLTLAYSVGVLFSDRVSCQILATLNLNRACAFVDEMKLLNRENRLEKLKQTLPSWMGTWFLNRRYLLIALLLNLPGNSLIGGGGGIAMIAGLSRTFSTKGVLLTFALATAPIPLAVYFFGGSILSA